MPPSYRNVVLLFYMRPFLHFQRSTLPEGCRIYLNGRVSGRLERKAECYRAHEYPHRCADVYRNHGEACVRSNQRRDERTETEISRSLTGA
jgi:hypothetical protein